MHCCNRPVLFVVALAALLVGSGVAQAQCALPYTINNGDNADASKLMANFNALVSCMSPGGSANAVQYNAGSGTFGGTGPLANGQLVIGSTGNAPQAGTLTAGTGIAITNQPGAITITASGAVGTV